MTGIYNLTRSVERIMGNVGLGVVAAFVFFIAITSTVGQVRSGGHSVLATGPTTTVVVTSTTPSTTATTLAETSTTATTVANTSTTAATSGARNGLNGFAAVNFTVTTNKKAKNNFCGLLASSASQQASGLMNQTSLGGYDGMIFPFAADTTAAFYMANVPIALSVAWFDKDGNFVSSADMEPCKVEASKCTLYKPTGAYRTAIEVAKGGLTALGVGSGSALSVGASGPC